MVAQGRRTKAVSWLRITVAGVLLAAAGCATTETITEGSLDQYYQQTVQWGSCAGFSSEKELSAAGMQCAKVTVPLDYAKLDGDTAQIAISKLPAGGAKVGSLLTNPGGPGGLGLAFPITLSKTAVAQRFDLIGVDVRGLGSSTPKVVCHTPEETAAERVDLDIDYSPAGIAQTERENQDLVNRCVERTGLDFLAHVGTIDVARDFDVIREALGDEKLNFYGGSYGTRLGSTIAELYPTRVRAMVLDGGIDPNDYMVDPVTYLAGFQRAFEAYAADCVKAADCPVGTDSVRATERFRALVNPLVEHSIPAGDQRTLGYADAVVGAKGALFSSQSWPALTKGLTELSKGRGDILLRLSDVFFDGGAVELDLNQAVLCREDKRITDRAAAADLDHRIRAAAPIFDDGHAPGDQAPLDVCGLWPLPVTGQPHVPDVTGLPQVVVVGVTGDPATPYAGGVKLAQALGASMVTYEGVQHGVFGEGVACVDDPVTRYLVDLTPPPADLHCPAQR
ncbi:alpha/beta hydrolase [Nocardia yamanashiensis]|uniref:alpha/beta hydrolase n=1 Tax=Nocardia yamanashiensis TaxID=209247 RepID=UPI00082CC23B